MAFRVALISIELVSLPEDRNEVVLINQVQNNNCKQYVKALPSGVCYEVYGRFGGPYCLQFQCRINAKRSAK